MYAHSPPTGFSDKTKQIVRGLLYNDILTVIYEMIIITAWDNATVFYDNYTKDPNVDQFIKIQLLCSDETRL